MTRLLAYTDRLWARPGETVDLHASGEGEAELSLVRVVCGDDSPQGPGYRVEETAVRHQTVGLAPRAVHAGSCIVAGDSAPLAALESFTVRITVRPTLSAGADQALMGLWDSERRAGWLLAAGPEGAVFLTGDGSGAVGRSSAGAPMTPLKWYRVTASHDAATGAVRLVQQPLEEDGSGEREYRAAARHAVVPRPGATPFIVGAAWGGPGHGRDPRPAMCFNGKVEAPRLAAAAGPLDGPLAASACALAWDFSRRMSGRSVEDVSPWRRHGRTVNLPCRAMTGSAWTGEEHDWRRAPGEYGAIHLHDDDVGDAGWPVSARVTLPDDLQSGIYCLRLSGAAGEDMPPVVVQRPSGEAGAPVAFLVSTATYQAYANMHHATDDAGAEMRAGRATRLSADDVYLFEHRELGLSPYDHHGDGSGVAMASARRPMLGYRPKSGVWSFTADTHVTAWLEQQGFAWDAISDHALHEEGLALLAPYRVVVTGAHPEYWSSAMWRAMTAWLAQGGRLMYLGGNGFYWKIAFLEDAPWALEIRRAQAGARYWIAEPGEYHMAASGELGGLWQRSGTAPQRLVGIGTVATGFDSCSFYRRLPGSFDPRASWIFDGVGADERIGDFGQLGGASGLELDGVDPVLGTPDHCLKLAISADHSPQYLQTVDTMTYNHTAVAAPVNPAVRADMVFFETPRGGAVFSTGSIAWCASLAWNGGDNNVSRITGNVLRRFADSRPFAAPRGDRPCDDF